MEPLNSVKLNYTIDECKKNPKAIVETVLIPERMFDLSESSAKQCKKVSENFELLFDSFLRVPIVY
jgi:hypothetical protein